MNRGSAYAAVCLVLLPAGVFAQRYSFKYYGEESGLTNQAISGLLQDSVGFLWISTENGLYRYDGKHFRAFTEADGVPSLQVEAMHLTPDRTLWVATKAGVARLRGDRFEAIDVSPARGAWSIGSDSVGRLYLGTPQGLLVSLSPPGSAVKPAFSQYTVPNLKNQAVGGIADSDSGVIWYGCGGQLCRLEDGIVVSSPEWAVPLDFWEAVAIDPEGNVWARSRTRLIELPKGTSRFLQRDAGLPAAEARGTLFIGRDGQVWVPTVRGLARRTATGWEIIGKACGLPISSVRSRI